MNLIENQDVFRLVRPLSLPSTVILLLGFPYGLIMLTTTHASFVTGDLVEFLR